eukprot:scaffold21421_cov63-Phaeocystis_antarctica.AAC.1
MSSRKQQHVIFSMSSRKQQPSAPPRLNSTNHVTRTGINKAKFNKPANVTRLVVSNPAARLEPGYRAPTAQPRQPGNPAAPDNPATRQHPAAPGSTRKWTHVLTARQHPATPGNPATRAQRRARWRRRRSARRLPRGAGRAS